jgi:hypothetical protein
VGNLGCHSVCIVTWFTLLFLFVGHWLMGSQWA